MSNTPCLDNIFYEASVCSTSIKKCDDNLVAATASTLLSKKRLLEVEHSGPPEATNRSKAVKREDAISWDDYFMAVAFLSSMRSKDPSTQVGACIVNSEKRIVGIGYNGFPRGCSDDLLPWDREAPCRYDTKYMYVCHAEVNAILNKNSSDLKNCTIYVALFPCNECAKVIIQSGIQRVVFMSDKYEHTDETKASKRMFSMSNINICQFIPKRQSITIDFSKNVEFSQGR